MNEWISVNDKVPDGGQYIVFIIMKEQDKEKVIVGHQDILYFDYYEQDWCRYIHVPLLIKHCREYLSPHYKVTHWMNLHKNPEIEGNFTDKWIHTNINMPDKNQKLFLLYRNWPHNILKIQVGTFHEYFNGCWSNSMQIIYWRTIPENWNESMGFPDINIEKLNSHYVRGTWTIDESISNKTS